MKKTTGYCPYSLTIRRYGLRYEFATYEELKAEVGAYFVKSERPIVEKLCDFSGKPDPVTHVYANEWRDLTVCYQPEETEADTGDSHGAEGRPA